MQEQPERQPERGPEQGPEHQPEGCPEQPERPERPANPQPATTARAARPPRTGAYDVLAGLGRTDPRMTLSAADCAALEELAGLWLARGATEVQVVHALTAGLPPQVHHPAALARTRLTAKLPPETAPVPVAARPALRVLECTVCRDPGHPEALPGGICGKCRGEAPPERAPAGLSPAEVRARVLLLRAAARTPDVRTPEETRP
ncbi:hypothetical protein [Streptomyces sp. H27-D2]|uniref:hypothetical protein n=1 Tax=Streptomyces sp. H27-D2 TaxID=3046304 RepID=UPI002DBB673A|nr:hypothetical protein [Streptomyces sp. H27-D2]MEC4020065.1 hypothetical protein [Streptomyces sp. H27-D2]